MNRKLSISPLRASTLAEMLVVILISGVVLTTVMDGMGLFRRFAARLTGEMQASGRFRESYYLLENLVTTADSLREHEGRVTVWLAGRQRAVLYQRDSLLLVSFEAGHDTLFTGVAAFEPHPANVDAPLDSLTVKVMRRSGEALGIVFPVGIPPGIATQNKIEESEKEFLYE